MSETSRIHRMASLHETFARRALPNAQRSLAEVREKTTSGRRVNRASDDPDAHTRILELDELISRQDQYKSTIGNARSWLEQSEQQLQHLGELTQRGYELALKGRDDAVLTQDERDTMAGQVQNLIDDAYATLNTEHGATGEYLFAGTESDTQPFSKNAPPPPNDVVYDGNTNEPKRRISKSVTLPVAVSGDRVLSGMGGNDLIQRLEDLRTALRNNDQPEIKDAIGELKTAKNHMISLTTEVGSRLERLDTAEAHLDEMTIGHRDRRSELEDVDYTEALSELQHHQTRYQAALKVSSQVLRNSSLVDFL